MNLKKSLYLLATSFSLSSSASAILPFNASQGVTHHFQNPQTSLVYGLIGLNTDLVKNIRFGFVEKVTYDTQGRRAFVDDKGSNPHWQISKILFPSVTGELGMDSDGRDNFSKHATFEALATLTMYAAEVRQILEETDDTKALRLSKMSAASLFKQPGLRALKERYQDRLTAPLASKRYGEDTLIPLLYNLTKALLWEKIGASLFPEYTTEQIISSFVCMKADTLDDIKTHYLTALEKFDEKGLVLRRVGDASPEARFHDITYFEEKDGQAVLAREAAALESAPSTPPPSSSAASSSTILSGPASSSGASTGASSSSAASSGAASSSCMTSSPALDMDALYGLFVLPFFKDTIPYMGNPPSHGPASFVRGPDSAVDHGTTFSDCNENALRTLMNLMTYNPKTRQFDLSFLEGRTGPRIDLLKAFYGLQTKGLVGAVSNNIRTAWNRVVGDLNSLDEAAAAPSSASSSASPSHPERVRYLHNHNDLYAGFANMLRVFEKIFCESFLPSFPQTSIHDQEQALHQGYTRLFSFIAPFKHITMHFTDLAPKDNDLAGNLHIKVGNDFHFTLHQDKGPHGHIEKLVSLGQKNTHEAQRLGVVSAFKDALHQGISQSMLLLDPTMAKQARHPFYQLVSQKILGNKEAITFLKKLGKMEARQEFVPLLRNVLSNIAWDDPHTQLDIAAAIVPLLSQEIYLRPLGEEVKFFVTTFSYPLAFALETFPHLEHLIVSHGETMTIDRPMTSLRRIGMPYTAARITGLGNLPALTYLHLSSAKMESLHIDGPMPALKSLTLPNKLKSITGLGNLPALETLDLHKTNVSELHIDGPMPALTKLFLPWKPRRVTGLEHLPSLEKLDLSQTTLSDQDLEVPMPALKTLITPATATQMPNMSFFPNLEYLDMTSSRIVSPSIHTPAPHLESLYLPDTATDFEGLAHMPSLGRMYIYSDTLTIKGPKDGWEVYPMERCHEEGGGRRIFAKNPSGISWIQDE